MGDKDDYLTSYRVFFENFAATVNPEDQLPVQVAGYTISETELPGEVIYWITQYLTEKQCPITLMTPLRRIILEEVRVASKKQPNEFGYVSNDSVYIALRLMQAVTARVNDVCLRYLDNSRLDCLPPPPPPALREYRTVSAATKNSRRVMEDRHVEIGNLEALFGIDTTEPTSFYAVYDGHAGSAAATYCAAHLHQYLLESPRFNTDLEGAMHDAFLRTDAEFVRKSNQERVYGGSTAVVVCVRARRLLAAWAGDSQALLAKRMRLMQLVNPHKPDREDERERIESSGGTVIHWGTWRVNGQLAVSRAIGDAQYKPYVTARPEMGVVDLDGDEDFVVVACDGLWDVVTEDAVALSVYQQLAADPDDLKAVAKRLVVQAKRVGSADNISVIVVFLKNPRDIVADNCPPMDLGLDNATVNAPPFAVDADPRKPSAVDTAEGACADVDADNGISDSDSEDLGPETAVDIDPDVDAGRDDVDDRGMNQAAAPTPPAHAVEEGHVDGNLVDNVAESGDESEDEWNYYKGEGDREQNVSEEADEPPRSETPCQDNSAWESSSVDMNSSPLNPEAPVFVPGTVAGSDMLLAESPRKPLPMDDIELPDVAQFNTEAVVRPAELLDLDNCDQLNGHHNLSMEGVTEHLNGNEKCEMESLGFGFNVGIDTEKIKDTELIQDFERIQKDTTDFCNIQVLQTHTAYNPFDADGDEELFERLKNKERDPMSMSFYQEKDDDTCERFGKNEPHVDLNAVQPLPDSDDEDMQTNGASDNANDDDKENVSPELENLLGAETPQEIQEPNNDIMMFDDRSANNINSLNSFMDFNITNANNVQHFSNVEFQCTNVTQENVAPTDTPESHKLLFEQIPEIPDGKSSELGFTNEDLQDPCESEKDTRVVKPQEEIPQVLDFDHKLDETSEEIQPALDVMSNENVEIAEKLEQILPVEKHSENEIISEYSVSDVNKSVSDEQIALSPEPEPTVIDESTNDFSSNQFQANVDVHQNSDQCEDKIDNAHDEIVRTNETMVNNPEIKLDTEIVSSEARDVATSKSPLPADASLPQSPLPTRTKSPLLEERRSPLPVETASELRPETASPRSSPMPDEVIEAIEETTTLPPAEIEQLHVESKQASSPTTLEAPQVAFDAAEPTDVSHETPTAADIVAPAPDIVPDRLRTELVTDIDIGIPESRAQEICVPVTNEIQHDDVVQPGATPPPTPAVEPAVASAPLESTPVVAEVPLAAATAVGIAAAATAAAVGVAKAKTPTAKKSPSTPTPKTDVRTPKSAPKSSAPAARTPASAKRPTAPATPAKTPTSTTKTPTARATPSKAPSSASKPATTPSRPSPAAPARASAKPAAPPAKAAPRLPPASAKEAPSVAKSAPAVRAAAPRPASKPAAPKPAAPVPKQPATASVAAKPAPRATTAARPASITAARTTAATKPKETKPKAPEKPVANGDVKNTKLAPRTATARPAPAAPRPAQRAPAAAPPPKSAAPKPASRAPLDKQSKDLANKRITAKAAPPRTAPIKAPLNARTAVTKPGAKKTSEKPPEMNGLSNGDGAEPVKAPPSPPAADNALLPDVIA